MRTIDTIIVHCSATREGQDVTTDTIRHWHVDGNGWSDIGYHYVIELDGRVVSGRPLYQRGAHCTGHNATSIGICYVGGLTIDGKKPKDTRTRAQRLAMCELIDRLSAQFSIPNTGIHVHNEYAHKACPSFSRTQLLADLEAYRLEG